MSILRGAPKTKQSEIDLVYTEDPDVTAPVHLRGCGWVPVAECTTQAGADVVTVRPLTADERTRHRDIGSSPRGGIASRHRYALQAGIVRVGKRRKTTEIAEWQDALAREDWRAHDLLGLAIEQMTAGLDIAGVYPDARRLLGAEEPASEAEAQAPKSAEA